MPGLSKSGRRPWRKKPVGVKELDIDHPNALIRSVRCLGERGFVLLTQRWKTLQRVTASPGRIGLIARAAFILMLLAQDDNVKVVEKTFKSAVVSSGVYGPELVAKTAGAAWSLM